MPACATSEQAPMSGEKKVWEGSSGAAASKNLTTTDWWYAKMFVAITASEHRKMWLWVPQSVCICVCVGVCLCLCVCVCMCVCVCVWWTWVGCSHEPRTKVSTPESETPESESARFFHDGCEGGENVILAQAKGFSNRQPDRESELFWAHGDLFGPICTVFVLCVVCYVDAKRTWPFLLLHLRSAFSEAHFVNSYKI